MSRETVVWTTSNPSSRSAAATSACVDSAWSRTSSRIACCASRRLGPRHQVVARAPLTMPSASSTSAWRDDERRRQPQHVRAGREHEQPLLCGRRRPRRRGTVETRAEQETPPAHLDHAGHARQAGVQLGAARPHVGEELLVDRLHDRAGRGAGDRVAAERRAVVPRHQASSCAFRHDERPDRQAVPETLRERDEIGLDTELLVGEERPGATHAGLHLVDAEQRPDLACDLRRRPRERRLERDDAAFAEHRLERARPRRRRRARPRARAPRCRSAARTTTPGTSGPNPPTWPADRSPTAHRSVRPWKPPSSATMRGLPVALRAYLSAASLASAPELQKNAWPATEPLGEERREPQHRLRPVQVGRVPEQVELFVGGGRDAGSQCPRPTTAIPVPKSRYARPSSSQTWQPSPRTMVTSARA